MDTASLNGGDDMPPLKVPRLGDEEMYKLPVGTNLIEIDGKRCTHEVAWPPGQTGSPMPPAKKVPVPPSPLVSSLLCPTLPSGTCRLYESDRRTQSLCHSCLISMPCLWAPLPLQVAVPAREYAFKLDPFQQTAIDCLEAGVNPRSHTSPSVALNKNTCHQPQLSSPLSARL